MNAQDPGHAAPETRLLKTKLFRPRRRPALVARPRLLARLAGAWDRALTLVSAPPGFGKTTLLVEWAETAGSPVAWLSLDEADNDPYRFLSYVVAALWTVRPDLGESALAALTVPGAPQASPLDAALALLINDLCELPGHLALVLDDYHLIKAQAVHAALIYLLDHLPPPLHVVIATRADPPLPLARLRGRMQLVELRQRDLGFTPDEAQALLNQAMGLCVSDADAVALQARTEGWAAGLQLAALSLAERQDVGAFVAEFSGSQAYILDYLMEEVLSRQPADVQTFLLQTAILDRLSAPLCNAVTGLTDSQARLEALQAANLFVVPLDDHRGWYRYHHLFADLLRTQLERRGGEAAELHRRASAWLADAGLVEEAVEHALAAGAPGEAAEMIERAGVETIMRGEVATLLRWLDALPSALVSERPWCCLLYGWVRLLSGQHAAVEPWLRAAEAGARGQDLELAGRGLRANLAAVRALLASAMFDLAAVTRAAEEALALLPDDDLVLKCVVTAALGTARIFAGDAEGACSALTEAAAMGRSCGNLNLAVGAVAQAALQHVALGRLHRAAASLQDMVDWAGGAGRQRSPLAAVGYVGLSGLAYEWNDLQAAERHAAGALELSGRLVSSDLAVRSETALARVLCAEGQRAAAGEALDRAEGLARGHSVSIAWAGEVAACRAHWWLSFGDLDAATAWAAGYGPSAEVELSYVREPEHLALAGALVALGRARPAGGSLAAARDLLARLQRAAAAGARTGRLIRILALQAMAERAACHAAEAHAALLQSLALAGPEGYVRTFVDEGAAMAELLAEVRPLAGPASGYVTRLLAAFGGSAPLATPSAGQARTSPGGLTEPLTERELEVLRLMQDGLANGEIARVLVVAVSTVKAHVNHIFAKLGATTRTQALARAREHGLL